MSSKTYYSMFPTSGDVGGSATWGIIRVKDNALSALYEQSKIGSIVLRNWDHGYIPAGKKLSLFSFSEAEAFVNEANEAAREASVVE